MPVLKWRAVLEMARDLKLFIDLKVGAARGPVPDDRADFEAQLREFRQRVSKARERLADREREAAEQLRMRDRRIARLENQLSGGPNRAAATAGEGETRRCS